MKRVFLIVADSLGIGELPDASAYGDSGSNTYRAIAKNEFYCAPTLERFGLGFSEKIVSGDEVYFGLGAVGKMAEKSAGKDTTTGHWEIAGLVSNSPLPTYPNGFPDEVIREFEKRTGRKVLCNKPYSGTEVIRDYGEQAIKEGALIVYTSADSVFQIAAHEDHIPLDELYRYCKIAREMLVGKHGVGRVIARPFTATHPFIRTANRHDYSIEPSDNTMLDLLVKAGKSVIALGKISDIFATRGVSESILQSSNDEGMDNLIAVARRDFEGLYFLNLVDFDSKYGHRNDADGYAKAVTRFDQRFNEFINSGLLSSDDIVIVTADHGCDPSTPSTDHSREYAPVLVSGKKVKNGVNLGVRSSFADISATILQYFGVDKENTLGKSFLSEIL